MRTSSKFADQLSALTGRPVLFKDVPSMVVVDNKGSRPIDPEASRKASLRRAVARFNSES